MDVLQPGLLGASHIAVEHQNDLPAPPNVPPLRALWSLLDGICGVVKGSWGAGIDFWFKDLYLEGY